MNKKQQIIKKYFFKLYYLYNIFIFILARYKPIFLNKIKYSPHIACINITDNCNSKCITCTQWKQTSQNELTTKELKNIFDQLSGIGVKNINLSGGEPMLRNDIYGLVRYASNLGLSVNIGTNGLLINFEKAEKLIKNGLSGVTISIDGPEEVHDKIRGISGSYKKTISSVEAFSILKRKYKNFDLSIATTIMRPTIDSIFEVLEYSIKYNLHIYFNLIDYNPYFFKNILWKDLWILDQEKYNKKINKIIKIKKNKKQLISNSVQSLEYAKKYFKDPLRKDIPCYLGFIVINIGAKGEVYPCWSMQPVGNIRCQTLMSIINSKIYKNNIINMWKKNCPGCSCSYRTNLDLHLPTFLREFSLSPKYYLKRFISL